MNHQYNLAQKKIRADVIAAYLHARGTDLCVCLTCGNAAEYLREAGLRVIEVGPKGLLDTNRWLTYDEVAACWPGIFDATSGHLPWPLMERIASRMPILDNEATLHLPTGSGETLVCLKLRNPEARITAVYNLGPETEYDAGAPLTRLVALLADDVITHPGDRLTKGG